MPTNEVTTWLNFALYQMAAESYLDGIANLEDRNLVRDRLLIGNNRPLLDPDLRGATRFTDPLSTRFLDAHRIVSHHANDSTGFSATLMQEIGTNNFTLSFRSTEFESQSNGGDFERDGTLGADGDVTLQGFAFAQLASMEEYYQTTVRSLLPPDAILNVTGYSLGGNLATVFTELHSSEVNHTYTFNAVGRGHISGPGATEAERMAGMVELFTAVLLDPEQGRSIITDPADPVYLAARARADQQIQSGQLFTPFASETSLGQAGNVYADPRYLWAKNVALVRYQTTGVVFMAPPGEVGTNPAFSQITQIYGRATDNDVEKVANRGVHGPITSVFIEDQPDFTLLGGFLGLGGSYGTTHSLTLIVDSLAAEELFQTIDPVLSKQDIEGIFAASSSQNAFGFVGVSGVAEGNSLENALDALGKLFVPNYSPTPFGRQTGDFGSLGFRNAFYTNLDAVKTSLAGATVTIEPFVTLNSEGSSMVQLPSSEVSAAAMENTDRGLAFRYALKALNPFAVIGADYIGLGQASNGSLALFDPASGFGAMTDQYLTDRAAFLKEKIELNLLNRDKSMVNIHFKEFVPNGLEIATTIDLRVDQEVLFGSDGNDGVGVLVGNIRADHLYGGGGNDLLEGNGGNDYLQGDEGTDRLDGGAGLDTLVGGAGDDFYIVDNLGDRIIEGLNNGTDRAESSVSFTLSTNIEHLTLTGAADLNGIGNELNNTITGNSAVNRLDGKGGTDHLIGGGQDDILVGGTGDNDLLEGGVGFDTYIYNNGDGIDRIEDSDANGRIVFNGSVLQGGVSTDGGTTFVSLDGSTTYVLSSGHLIVNELLTINENFQSGQFGIDLTDLSNAPHDTGAPTGPFAFSYNLASEEINGSIPDFLAGPGAVYGNASNNVLDTGFNVGEVFADLLDGSAGNDTLIGRGGQDYLIGGLGNDYAYVSDGDVFLGGDDADIMAGSTSITNFTQYTIGSGAHYGDGGLGDDVLMGALGVDVLKGGTGDDQLWGDNRPAGWIGQVANGEGAYISVPQTAFFSAAGAADVLDGGAGNDYLKGDAGDDILSGGPGNDQLFGDDEAGYLVALGNDVLDGGTGDDLLAAGDGNDSLSGGAGIDELYGDKGADILDGGEGADILHGGDGADELFGGAGNDFLYGDGLNNRFADSTAGAADFLDGGEGDDELQGGVGEDALFGGAGDDRLFGQNDNDALFGDAGNDQLQGGFGDDLLGGDGGDDLLNGDVGRDTLFGDEGNDAIAGNEGDDTLHGGAGNDTLQGDQGNDALLRG